MKLLIPFLLLYSSLVQAQPLERGNITSCAYQAAQPMKYSSFVNRKRMPRMSLQPILTVSPTTRRDGKIYWLLLNGFLFTLAIQLRM